ncbi:peptidase [Shewanella sp. OPT22]|nr:peptidase [Shewanella sp. OPT22]
MKSITIKKIFQMHSWVGIVTGILLFIVAFTGAFAVFSKPYLSIWASSSDTHVTSAVPAKEVDRLINEYAEKVPEKFRENIHVFMPNGYGFTKLVLLFESHDGDENYKKEAAYVYELNSQTLALEDQFYGSAGDYYENRQSDMARYIGHFHADLHLGRPIGLILTGFLGLTLMVSVITGLYIHREMFKQLFTFRRDKSFDVVTSDGHKLFGLWGSLFHFVIGFTGAILGLATIIMLPAAAYVSFNGDQDKLVEKFTAMPDPVISQDYQKTRVVDIMANVQAYDDKAILRDLTIMALNDKNSVVYARTIGGESVSSSILKYTGEGEFVKRMSSLGDIPGPAIKVVEWIYPLHFGNFGGLFVKFIWAFLGLTTALIPLSGVMMWLAKRSRGQNPDLSQVSYQRWNRFVIGSCGGAVMACILLFPVQILMNHFIEGSQHNSYFGPIFFGSWLAWLVISLMPINYHALLKVNTLIVALSFACVVPLKLMLQPGFVGQVMSPSYQIVTAVDVMCTLMAILSFYVFKKLSVNPTTEQAKMKEQTA